MPSPETRCTARIHQQFLLRRERPQELQKARLLIGLQSVAAGEIADAPDLLQSTIFDVCDGEMCRHGSPRSSRDGRRCR